MSNTTDIKVVRVTKAQKYNAIINLLNGGEPTIIPGKDDKLGVTMDAKYLTDFCKAELALLSKKNTTTNGNKKLTKEQKKNEGYKKEIFAYLQTDSTLIVTASDIMDFLKGLHPDEPWSNQKAASLLNAMSDKYDKDSGELVSEGLLDRTEGKGKNKTTFKIKAEYADTTIEDGEADEEE